jgi:putative ABC transport system permease protein
MLDDLRDERHKALDVGFLEASLRDVRYGIRMLSKTPVVTLMAVMTLTLGIGLNAALFSVLDALLFKALPVAKPEQLVQLKRADGDDNLPYWLWRQVRAQQDPFSGMLACSAATFDSADGGEKKLVNGQYVSGDYFSTLGVPAMLGRTLTNQDDRRGAAPVAMLSYVYWQRQFGGNPAVLGREIMLDKHGFQIVGVMPSWFHGTDVGYSFDVAIPLESERNIEPDNSMLDRTSYSWLYVFGRLKQGVSLDSAQARMQILSRNILSAAPSTDVVAKMRGWNSAIIEVFPAATGTSDLRETYSKALILLNVMLGIVLMIACANVANLQLVRFDRRRREFAIRAALGAMTARLLRQLVIENLMLSALGAGLGLLLARYTSLLLILATSDKTQRTVLDLSLDLRLVLFVAGVTIGTTILFGIVPALKLAQVSPQTALKQESQLMTGRAHRTWTRILIPVQVGLSMVLLFGATLFLRSLDDLLRQKLGFNKDNILLVKTDLEKHQGTYAQRQHLATILQERMMAHPGVLSVSRSAVTPISGVSWQSDVKPEGGKKDGQKVHVFINMVSPGFFNTLGTPLIAGRDFGVQDTPGAAPVAIVNRTAALRIFGDSDPVGWFYQDIDHKKDQAIQIVGVAEDAKYRHLRDVAPATIYIPIEQNPSPMLVIGTYEIHFSGGALEITKEVEEAARSVDPRMSLDFELLSTQVDDSLRQMKIITWLASGFGLLAMILACVGIYGVMAYGVSQRTTEIGVRIALGAGRFGVLQMVMREALKLIAVGLVIGISGAMIGARFVSAMLFGVRPFDPASLIAAAALITTTAGLAAFTPAARAARIDPANSIRYE